MPTTVIERVKCLLKTRVSEPNEVYQYRQQSENAAAAAAEWTHTLIESLQILTPGFVVTTLCTSASLSLCATIDSLQTVPQLVQVSLPGPIAFSMQAKATINMTKLPSIKIQNSPIVSLGHHQFNVFFFHFYGELLGHEISFTQFIL